MTTEQRYDAAIIGAGHNGLVAAAYLAKAGRRIVVLEKRDRVGGLLDTVEIAKGVRAPGLAHTVGRLRASVIDALALRRHGFEPIVPDARVFAPRPEGAPALTLWSDVATTSSEMRAISAEDAGAYPRFDRKVRAVASFLAYLNAATPPDVKNLAFADLLTGLRAGRAFRELGARAGRETTRVLPMAVADFVAEAFLSDSVRGAIASRAVQFVGMGPWSAGTAFVLLNDSAGNDGGAAGQTVFARGGPGALANALASAARSFGAEIRTAAEVTDVVTRDHRAVGVALASGEEITARTVVSAADPKRTLTTLVDPVILGPELVWRAGNIRTPGIVSKVNLALSAVPRFDGGRQERLRGRIVIAPSIDYLERAFDASKYGRISDEPYLEATIPTLTDASLAPAGTHVMSVIAQWTPYRLVEGAWTAERDRLADLVVKTLETYAPGIGDLVTARQVLSPVDLEAEYGFSQGDPLHAEPGLDQFFAWRPLLGHARYRFGIDGLYLCGSGAHPGGGVTGAPGANAAREILADLRRSA
jgi:phytoene dehydrogenase-like protein